MTSNDVRTSKNPRKKFFTDIFSIAEKELKIKAIAKWQMLLDISLVPIVNLVITLVIYSGFFISGSTSIGSVTTETFLSFLFLGNLAATVWIQMFMSYFHTLNSEKYWGTLNVILIAPINRISYLLGVVISVIVQTFPLTMTILVVTYLITPTFFLNMIFSVLVIYILSVGCAGFGVIWGVVSISNENLNPIMYLLQYGWIFFTCIQYPAEIFPPFIQSIINLNPLYHGVNLIRNGWVETNILTFFSLNYILSFLFIIGFSILLPALGIFLFNRIWKKYGYWNY